MRLPSCVTLSQVHGGRLRENRRKKIRSGRQTCVEKCLDVRRQTRAELLAGTQITTGCNGGLQSTPRPAGPV